MQIGAQRKIQWGTLSLNLYSKPGDGPCILFLHGNSSSSEVFSHIFESPRFEKFHCLALDLPGHGGSQWDSQASKDPSIYTLPYYAQAIEDVLRALSIEHPIVVGHSLGGHLGALLSSMANIAGLFSFQAPPLQRADDASVAFSPCEEMATLFTGEYSEASIQAFVDRYVYCDRSRAAVRADFERTDPLCRSNMGGSLVPGYRIGDVTHLNQLAKPKALVYTDKDPMINKDYLEALDIRGLWRGSSIELKESGHYPQLEIPRVFAETLVRFLNTEF